jgi:hypothetical protein
MMGALVPLWSNGLHVAILARSFSTAVVTLMDLKGYQLSSIIWNEHSFFS